MAGYTNEGLVIPRLPELIETLVTAGRIKINPNINTDPDLLLGQLFTVISDAQTVAYEYLEKANQQKKLQSAEGRGLDELGRLKFVDRLLASSSQVELILEGLDTILVPQNALIEDKTTKQRFLTTVTKRIYHESCVEAKLIITNSNPSTTFTITVEGTAYSVTTPSSGVNMTTSLAVIRDALITAGYTATSDATSVTVAVPDYADDAIEVVATANFNYGTIKSKVLVQSINVGSSTAATPGDWLILSPVPGWNKSYPIISTSVSGRDDETDVQYRYRIQNTEAAEGRGTQRALKSRLRDTVGVSYADVFTNRTGVTVGDLPPYSVLCVVDGGDDDDIAKTIWETVQTYGTMVGTESVVYTDEYNQPQVVKFSKPTSLQVDVEVSYSIYPEESLSVDIQDTIRTAITNYINNLGLGLDVIPSKLFVPIYQNVSGINVTQMRVKEHGTPTWQTTPLVVPGAKFAQTQATGSYISFQVT